jgi:hypothetical protein
LSEQSNPTSETTGEVSIKITSIISQSSDYAEEITNTGEINITSSYLEFVRDDAVNRGQQSVGMRFQDIQVPRGSTITNAYIELEIDETGSESTTLISYGEASDNPDTFTEIANNLSSRPKTSSSVNWDNIPQWNTVGEKHLTLIFTRLLM